MMKHSLVVAFVIFCILCVMTAISSAAHILGQDIGAEAYLTKDAGYSQEFIDFIKTTANSPVSSSVLVQIEAACCPVYYLQAGVFPKNNIGKSIVSMDVSVPLAGINLSVDEVDADGDFWWNGIASGDVYASLAEAQAAMPAGSIVSLTAHFSDGGSETIQLTMPSSSLELFPACDIGASQCGDAVSLALQTDGDQYGYEIHSVAQDGTFTREAHDNEIDLDGSLDESWTLPENLVSGNWYLFNLYGNTEHASGVNFRTVAAVEIDYRSGGSNGGGSSSATEHTYAVPYSPMDGVYSLGFAVSNVANDVQTNVVIEYLDNDGIKIGQDQTALPARGHTVFMRGPAIDRPGWARVTATSDIYGTVLVFAPSGEKMLDEVFASETATDFVVGQWATNAGWKSTACLANPNDYPAAGIITLYPSTNHARTTHSFSIPAQGAIQLDIGSILAEASGTALITSNKGLSGFLLYTNPAGTGYHGGLAIEPAR